MKHKFILLLSIIINAMSRLRKTREDYICKHLTSSTNGFFLCEPRLRNEAQITKLKKRESENRNPKSKDILEFPLHVFYIKKPHNIIDVSGSDFVIEYLGSGNCLYTDRWKIGTNQPKTKTKVITLQLTDIFSITAVRLFYDRVVKLKMLYNYIVGKEDNNNKQPTFFSEYFIALRYLEGFIKYENTSSNQLKSLINVLRAMISLNGSLSPAERKNELGIVQFLTNLKITFSELLLVNTILEHKVFSSFKYILKICDYYNRECILNLWNSYPVPFRLNSVSDGLIEFFKIMKTEGEFNATVTTINNNQYKLLSNKLLSNPKVLEMGSLTLENAKKIVDSFGTLNKWDNVLLFLKNNLNDNVLQALEFLDSHASEKPDRAYLINYEKQYGILKEGFVGPYLKQTHFKS
jgi:hypothetical protein